MDDIQTRKLRFLLGFAAFFVGLWFMWNTSLVYPLKIFVVLLHEISHGIASVLTGGTIERITLDPRQGGACYCGGGNNFLTLSAGYLGSLLWGGAMFSAARADWVKTEWVNGFIGVMVIGLTLLFVRTGFGDNRDTLTGRGIDVVECCASVTERTVDEQFQRRHGRMLPGWTAVLNHGVHGVHRGFLMRLRRETASAEGA